MVGLRLAPRPPRVLGLVVEVASRRTVFLPITRVTVIEADAIIFDGRLNVRRFSKRESETLVIAEMLDRTIRFSESGESVSVVDVAMEPTRTRDWLVTKVAVRRRTGRGLRRRGESLVVDWDAVEGFSAVEHGQGAAGLIAAFGQMKAADLANIVHERLRSGAPRSRRRWTTSGSPTSWRSCPRTTRSRSSASSAWSGPPTCWRRWARTTPPTCSASCRPSSASGC